MIVWLRGRKHGCSLSFQEGTRLETSRSRVGFARLRHVRRLYRLVLNFTLPYNYTTTIVLSAHIMAVRGSGKGWSPSLEVNVNRTSKFTPRPQGALSGYMYLSTNTQLHSCSLPSDTPTLRPPE